jgi:hypothetical protein
MVKPPPTTTSHLISQQSGLAKANLLHMYNKGLSQATDTPVDMVNFPIVSLWYRSQRVASGPKYRRSGTLGPYARPDGAGTVPGCLIRPGEARFFADGR